MDNNASTPLTTSAHQHAERLWHNLGFWNFYFLGKFVLYWAGYINFDVFYNTLFFVALLAPLRPVWLQRTRKIIAIPCAAALLYHDTWFPHFSRLLAQPDIWRFSTDYILELTVRFFNWKFIIAVIIFWVV